jgi:hypothetical protein
VWAGEACQSCSLFCVMRVIQKMVMHEYGRKGKANKETKSWKLKHIPMYTKGNDTRWRYPVERGKFEGWSDI